MIYQVKTYTCDGEEQKETYWEVDAACGVYALRLGDMITKRPLGDAHLEEVRLVDVHVAPESDDDVVLVISSGRVRCSHEAEEAVVSA